MVRVTEQETASFLTVNGGPGGDPHRLCPANMDRLLFSTVVLFLFGVVAPTFFATCRIKIVSNLNQSHKTPYVPNAMVALSQMHFVLAFIRPAGIFLTVFAHTVSVGAEVISDRYQDFAVAKVGKHVTGFGIDESGVQTHSQPLKTDSADTLLDVGIHGKKVAID